MDPKKQHHDSRRRFIRNVGLGLVNAYTSTRSSTAFSALTETQGKPRLYEHSYRPQNYETPVELLAKQRITPIEHLFIRCHFDTPQIDTQKWRLNIDGLVNQSTLFSLAELNQFHPVSIEAVLQCSGNGRAQSNPKVPGVQWNKGAMGNVVWTGVRLATLLAKAGIQEKTQHLVMQGADRPVLPTTPSFIRSIPIAKALHPDTLIATKLNGLPIPAAHGGPARVIVPGWVADDWVKWISRLTLSAHEAKGFYFEKAYRLPIAKHSSAGALEKPETEPMSLLNVKSVITQPVNKNVLPLGTHEIRGVAFSGGNGIARVAISTDGGRTWQNADLERPDSRYAWTVWHFNWKPSRQGRYRLSVRATDTKGNTQPQNNTWNPGGYLLNAVDSINVDIVG